MMRVFESPHHPPRFRRAYVVRKAFTQLFIDAAERAILARMLRLIIPIYGNIHPAHRDGDSMSFPFCATNLFATVRSAQATIPITVSVERSGVKYILLIGTTEEIYHTTMDSSRG